VHCGDTLVPEVPINFVDTLETTHYQPFQIQLRSNPEVQVHVEGIVMSDKRPGNGASGDRLHHRRLDFKKTVVVEIIADIPDQHVPLPEDLPDLSVGDKVHITLPVAQFYIL